MKMFRECIGLASLMALASCGGGSPAPASTPVAPDTSALTRISLASPFPALCDSVSPTGTSYENAEVEPSFAVNPANPQNLFASWQQDRWSDGGAHSLLGAVSFDGGATWTPHSATFSRCAGGNSGNNGDWERASDPWVSFSPNGNAYWMALSFSDSSQARNNAMLVARSSDGGASWGTPLALIVDNAAFFNDKNSLTADPTDSGFVYAIWDRLDSVSNKGPSWWSRSTNGGVSWETARAIYDPGVNRQTIGNQVVVLPDGTLVDLLTELNYDSNTATLEVIRSPDQGQTWSAPVFVADLLSVGSSDPETGQRIRDGGIIGEIAVGPVGDLHVVWQDSRFSGGVRDGVALANSTDGGLTWSVPVQVNSVPGVAAFTPAVAVAGDGTLAVSYFDLRENTTDAGTLPTDYWLATSANGSTWTERKISGPFDQDLAPVAGGLFLGDYEGLLASGSSLRALFVQTNGTTTNRTDVYTRALPVAAAASAAKVAVSGYRAIAAPKIAMTRDWRVALAQRVLRERHHFPNKATPVTARDD